MPKKEGIAEAVDAGWAESELGNIELGDKRLRKRLLQVAEDLSSQPEVPINHASKDWAATKAAYRLFDHSNVTDKKLFEVHRKRTRERLIGERVVLAVQDTTYLTYEGHSKCEGMGYIGTEQLKGVILHSTLMVTPSGLPLGLITQDLSTRTEVKRLTEQQRTKLPIEEKESYRWIAALRETELYAGSEGRTIVTVGDRECDIFEFLHEAQSLNANYVVRSCADRKVIDDDTSKLRELLQAQPISGQIRLNIPSRNGTKGRTVALDVRYARVEIDVPRRLRNAGYSPVSFWAVMTSECKVESQDSGVEWMLLTNKEVSTFEDAAERIGWYQRRWQIEIFHKILKSGCNVEDCRLETIKRLKAYLSLFSIIAWRIFYCTHICRTDPKLPALTILSLVELEALSMLAGKKEKQRLPITTVRTAIIEIAKLGGFMARRYDGFPGPTSLWRGFRKLANATEMWEVSQALKCG